MEHGREEGKSELSDKVTKQVKSLTFILSLGAVATITCSKHYLLTMDSVQEKMWRCSQLLKTKGHKGVCLHHKANSKDTWGTSLKRSCESH